MLVKEQIAKQAVGNDSDGDMIVPWWCRVRDGDSDDDGVVVMMVMVMTMVDGDSDSHRCGHGRDHGHGHGDGDGDGDDHGDVMTSHDGVWQHQQASVYGQ